MRHIFARLILSVSSALILAGTCERVTAASANRIFLNSPEKIAQTVGDSVIVQLALDSGVSLVHGYNVHLTFDTTILHLDNITASTSWDSAGISFLFWKDTSAYDSTTHLTDSYVDLAAYYLGRSLHIDGFADVARLRFTALRHGATFVYFDYVLVQDTLLHSVLNQSTDGAIWVCPLPPGFLLYGDVTGNKFIDLADLSALVSYLTGGLSSLKPITLAGDWNCSGIVDLGDLSAMVSYLTTGAPRPCNLCP